MIRKETGQDPESMTYIEFMVALDREVERLEREKERAEKMKTKNQKHGRR